MNSQNAKIDICVATYRRPGLLSKLLESLEQQELGPMLECQIVVIDNDATGTAREIVEKFLNLARAGTVTLLYAATDTERNNAIVLREYLEESARKNRFKGRRP